MVCFDTIVLMNKCTGKEGEIACVGCDRYRFNTSENSWKPYSPIRSSLASSLDLIKRSGTTIQRLAFFSNIHFCQKFNARDDLRHQTRRNRSLYLQITSFRQKDATRLTHLRREKPFYTFSKQIAPRKHMGFTPTYQAAVSALWPPAAPSPGSSKKESDSYSSTT